MTAQFVHLHVHSEFSLVDGVARIKPLVAEVANQGMPAIALTDQSNMFALVRFFKAAVNAGVKPICGVDLLIRNPEDANKPYQLVLLIQNATGYRRLTELVSRSYREGQHLGLPMVDMQWLTKESCEGLIALSGASKGDVGVSLLAGNQTLAKSRAKHWASLFEDRYYLQLVRTGRADEEECLHQSVALADALSLPVVATNAV